MKRGVLIFLLVMLGLGCTTEGDPEVLVVLGNQYVSRKTQCVIKAQAGALEMLPIGTMDLLVTHTYYLYPIVLNQLHPLSSTLKLAQEQGYEEMHNVKVVGAYVWYEISGLSYPYWATDEDGDGVPDQKTELPDRIFVPTSGTVQPQSQLPFILEVVPPEVGAMLDADVAFDELYSGGTMYVHVQLVGYMSDGSEVRSQEFLFPLIVCRGCLVYYSHVSPIDCCITAEEPEYYPCHPGQDEGVACQLACAMVFNQDRWQKKVAMIMRLITSLSEEPPDNPTYKKYIQEVSSGPQTTGE